MAKHPTNPLILDDCRFIRTGLFNIGPDRFHRGAIRWKGGSSVSYTLITIGDQSNIVLTFNINGHPVRQQIELTSIPSNLGLGRVWFFICPVTKTRCRKLHFISRWFVHRTAVAGCVYQKQIEPKGFRVLRQSWEFFLGIESELNLPGMKSVYRGQPTKRVLRLMERIRKEKPGMVI